MAAALPASLKLPDITRFAHRAAQLEKVKPVIWYWSSFHIANQILEKNLHTKDGEALAFTTKLMDDLEQYKARNSTNDAVTDDVAGKAYVEQFALETFSRADHTVRANKATKQTADTFQAAGTFLDLLSIWPPIEPEIAAKSKYAKYHALRIVKAIRAGEDPNLSNPQVQPEPEDGLPPLDPNDAEVQAIEGRTVTTRQPSVVDAVDETDRLQAQLARTSSLDQSLQPSRDSSEVRRQQQPSVVDASNLARHPSQDVLPHPSSAPSLPRSVEEAVSPLASHDAASFYTGNAPVDISPVEPPAITRKPSIGGNYFPVTPQTQSSEQPIPIQPQTQSPPVARSLFSVPTEPQDPQLPKEPSTFKAQMQPAINAPISPPPRPNLNYPPPPPQHQQIPSLSEQSAIPAVSPPTQHYQPPPTYQHVQGSIPPTQAPTYASQPPPAQNVVVDEEAMMKAQKHARWAISALNFEDVQTAIRELEGALRVLGAR